jgi:hypothetical protein
MDAIQMGTSLARRLLTFIHKSGVELEMLDLSERVAAQSTC